MAAAIAPEPADPPAAFRAAAFAGFAAAVAARSPGLLSAPRLWGEEASVYLSAALDPGGWPALVAPHMGYYSVVPNAASAIAAAVPLEQAPLVTTLVAMLAQCVPAAVIVTSRAPAFRGAARCLAALAIVALVPFAGESWLNSVNSQFHLAAAAALVLAEPPADATARRTRWFSRAVLVLAALSGPGAALLLPAFAWRLVRTPAGPGRREASIHAAILAGGAALQAAAMLSGAGERPDRWSGAEPQVTVVAAVVKTIVVPYLGRGAGNDATAWIGRIGATSSLPYLALAAGLAIVTAWALVRTTRGEPERQALALAWGALVAGSLTFAAGSRGAGGRADLVSPLFGARYAVAPAITFAVLLLAGTAGGGRVRRVASAAAVGAFLLVGAAGWSSDLGFVTGAGFPAWRDEVARHRADPTYSPRGWPANHVVRIR